MPDDSWLLAAIFLLGIVLTVIQCFIWRDDRRRKRRDRLSELRDTAFSVIRSASASLVSDSQKNILEEEATYRYERLLAELPDELRKSAPKLQEGDDPLGGSLEVRVFLAADPRWRDLLD